MGTDKTAAICDKRFCTGCSACFNICPVKAISMVENEFGEINPQISNEKCISCDKCRAICPGNSIQQFYTPEHYFGGYYDSNISNSASGGLFLAIASSCLKTGGIVYGAAYRDRSFQRHEASVDHIRITSIDDLYKIQGSKYVQSNIGNSYVQVKDDLNKGNQVLFSGTPCQISGLLAVIPEKLLSNLFLIDIICHGICGAGLFRDYINTIWQSKEIIDFAFRDKSAGWGLNARISYRNRNGKEKSRIIPCMFLSYYQIFLKGHFYRESCYECKYARRERVSDITLGDFWGIEKEHPNFCQENDVKKGVSSISINSNKGRYLLNMTNGLKLFETDYFAIARNNEQIVRPSDKGRYFEEYRKCYKEGGYIRVERFFNAHELNYWLYLKNKLADILNGLRKKHIGN